MMSDFRGGAGGSKMTPKIRTSFMHVPFRGRSQTTFKRRGRLGGPKMYTFFQRLYHRKCQRRGVARWSKEAKVLST